MIGNQMTNKEIDTTVAKISVYDQLTIVLETIIFLQEKRRKLEQELDKLKEKKDE
jgi:hypothetical protein